MIVHIYQDVHHEDGCEMIFHVPPLGVDGDRGGRLGRNGAVLWVGRTTSKKRGEVSETRN